MLVVTDVVTAPNLPGEVLENYGFIDGVSLSERSGERMIFTSWHGLMGEWFVWGLPVQRLDVLQRQPAL